MSDDVAETAEDFAFAFRDALKAKNIFITSSVDL